MRGVAGSDTKIDNLVQIGHNVHIGRGCLLCAHAALAGSSTLGDYCTLGGKSAVADHIQACIASWSLIEAPQHGSVRSRQLTCAPPVLQVCSNVRLAACSGITKHITQPGDYAGWPAQPARAWRREVANIRRLQRPGDVA